MTEKDWETFLKQWSGLLETPNYDTGCHEYKLVDIIEKYGIDETGYHGFLYHEYAIVCLKCGSSKIVREDTYYKMMEHGVLYNAD